MYPISRQSSFGRDSTGLRESTKEEEEEEEEEEKGWLSLFSSISANLNHMHHIDKR
jgi:hypothetical protein